jgi:RNA polymerase sigma-70 factor (ECF subfamily)
MRLVMVRVGGDRYLAEEIVQETMLRAWRNAEILDIAPGPAQAWLTTVAKNLIVDTYRRRQTRPQEVPHDPYRPDNALSCSDGYAAVLASLTVQRTLEKLNPEQREVIRLIYLMDYSMDEAAQELGIPKGTVKSRLFYALRAMRQILEQADARADRVR